MTPTNKSYPYPVLGNGDDYTCEFNQNVIGSFATTSDEIIIELNLEAPNDDIAKLIESGDAKYICEIYCNKTFYREPYEFGSNEIKLNISREKVCDIVYIKPYIVAAKEIKNFSSIDFNVDYEDFTFDFTLGDILATYKVFKIDTEINYNNFYAGDFMQIGRTDSEEIEFDLDENIIYINLPDAIKEVYQNNKSTKEFRNYFLNSVILPALIYALSNFKQYKDKLWARTLDYRIRKGDLKEFFEPTFEEDEEILPFHINQIPKIAQKIFSNPYKRMFITEPFFNLE